MGTFMRNRQVVGGTPVVDTALDTQSEDVVQNKVVAEAISTINSKLDKLTVHTVTENITTNDYNWLIFPDNRLVSDARVGAYISLFVVKDHNHFVAKKYMNMNANDSVIQNLEANTSYSVTYDYIALE